MKLINLTRNVACQIIQGNLDREIAKITDDSRKVAQNDLFVCIRGARCDGHQFIQNAIEQGATAILIEDFDEELTQYPEITFLQTGDSRKALAVLAANWFGHPLQELSVIGITGTKGKTTTAGMIRSILEKAGHQTGLIGTTGVVYGSVKKETENTTPDALRLHAIFCEMVAAGCSHVVMEASSQGFKHHRTWGIEFDYGLFLNIDHDHIGENEHASFDEYLNCKRMIFGQSRQMIVNRSQSLWDKLSDEEKENSVTFGLADKADYYPDSYQLIRENDSLGSVFQVAGNCDWKMSLQIPGDYNIENALAAIALADRMGIDRQVVVATLADFEAQGRGQVLKGALDYERTVLVDYAHNGMSMRKVLQALKAYGPRRLICVFGMRGDETKIRRYDMGQAAGKFADWIILTEDNPGPERLEQINSDIIRGINDKGYQIIPDRREAINYAIHHAGRQDIVVLIGKGHERYHEKNGERIFFSEEEIVLNSLRCAIS